MKHIGEYTILGRLGRGGMGVVYKAAMPLVGRVVALKLCHPTEILADVMGLDAIRAAFIGEARTMATISHPNVATVLDAGEAEVAGLGRMPFFTMEYLCNNLGMVMGEGYRVELPSRRLSPDAALGYARQMTEGLARLHFSGLVHRDVKPFNVMLDDDDTVRLIDFGLSRLRNEGRGEMRSHPKGMVVGSPYYTAPEQEADPDAADARSDLYSVGVTLFRMLTGRLPETEAGDRLDAADFVPGLPAEFGAFFATALAHAPQTRFTTARDMLDGLEELAAAWDRERERACALEPEPEVCPQSGPVRSEPVRVGLKQAREVFSLDDLWRPAQGCSNVLRAEGQVVRDPATGLVWQRTGSEYPLDYRGAQQFVAGLAEKRYAGREGWRLPTVAELLTLLRDPARPGGFCLEPVFDTSRRRLWSADTKAFTAAWYVDADLGFVGWQDLTCRFSVRGVCAE